MAERPGFVECLAIHVLPDSSNDARVVVLNFTSEKNVVSGCNFLSFQFIGPAHTHI